MQTFGAILIGTFRFPYIAVHAAAFVSTYVFVVTGFDWKYFLVVSQFMPRYVLFVADVLGIFVPFFLPIGMVLYGIKRNECIKRAGFISGCAVISAFIISMTYKAFTGRISPPHYGQLIDVSNQFNFGFMEHSIIGGWPSSHAMVAFALAVTLAVMYKQSKVVAVASLVCALFIALSETIGFHWFSEFFAGSIIGIAIGLVAGRMHAALQR